MRKFLLDANVLVSAHRQYYQFSFCPAFWDCLLQQSATGKVSSIDRVKDELSNQGDALDTWVSSAPSDFFLSTADESVVKIYADLMQWAQDANQYTPSALTEFATVADAWLIAHAKANDLELVTLEARKDPNVKKRIPIPNAADDFDVKCITTFEMLEELSVSFILS